MKIQNVYRCFDEDGALLYVGISWSAPVRFGQHSMKSPWWAQVKRIELEVFSTRNEAEAAEKKAIREERPLFNRAHADLPAAEVEDDPALDDWQVAGARRNAFGSWDVTVICPGGRDLWRRVRADSLHEAVQLTLTAAPRILEALVAEDA